MQICFPDREYDSAVKPYWNDTCQELSDQLFLPAVNKNKPNFTVSVISRIIQKILPVKPQNFPVSFKVNLETKPDIVVKTRGRSLNRKAVHNMLSLRHYRFKTFLLWMAQKYGKKVIIVNESYTSKTRSWNGVIDEKLGSSKNIKENEFIVDRDINGARGIYLKHVAFALQNAVT